MEFLDRIEETGRLRRFIDSVKPSFAALYGRRRVGKSTLLKRVLTSNDIYFLADRSEASHQRRLLAEVVSLKFSDFNLVEYPDWESLLRGLNYRTENNFTLVLDEFPYLVEQSPELPSVLQKILDEKQLKYSIIVCGSSQHMMYGLLFDSSAPLYGRAKLIMKITPITLPYIQEALSLSAQEAVREYSIWGGVPRYWELREDYDSMDEMLWQQVFSVNGLLYDEPAKLFQDDIKDIVKVATIMSYIAAGANRISEIAARCNQPVTNLSRPLAKLIDLGFIYRETPFGVDEKNSKKTLYRISDPFLAFYYRFVVPNRSFIELDRRKPIEMMIREHFDEYVSGHWEIYCQQAVTGNEIYGVVYGKASRWWGSVLNQSGKPEAIELDVVAESLDGKYLLVGECKWTESEDAEALTAELMRKASMLSVAQNHQIIPVLFLKNPPKIAATNVFLPNDVLGLMR